MNKKTGTLFFLIFILAMRSTGIAQVNDAGLWFSANLEKKITPAWTATLSEEVRMYENMTEVGEFFTDAGLSYRFLKKFRISASYRFSSQKRLDDSYETRHRWYADISYRHKIKPLAMILRVRYMSRYSDVLNSGTEKTDQDHLTAKLTVKYNTGTRFEPYVSAEPFFRLNHIVYGAFDQMRMVAGVNCRINRMNEIGVYYLVRKQYNVKHPQTDYVVGLEYNLTF